jgi:hypothetical protein
VWREKFAFNIVMDEQFLWVIVFKREDFLIVSVLNSGKPTVLNLRHFLGESPIPIIYCYPKYDPYVARIKMWF